MRGAYSFQKSGVGSVCVGFGGCKHNKPHLPAALGLSPILSAFLEIGANPAESISVLAGKHQDQLLPCTSQADPEQDKGAPWNWECSGREGTTAFLLQFCKSFLFLSLVLLGRLQLFLPPSTFCTANSCFSPSVWLCNPWLVSNQPFSMVMNGLTFCFLMSNRKNVSELSKNNWN